MFQGTFKAEGTRDHSHVQDPNLGIKRVLAGIFNMLIFEVEVEGDLGKVPGAQYLSEGVVRGTAAVCERIKVDKSWTDFVAALSDGTTNGSP